MQADENRIYCLTADHVLSPENRSTPIRVKIKHHSHVVGLRVGSKSNEYPLRRKFYNNEEVDIALAESALSGTDLVDRLDARCVPIDKILYAADITVHPDDLFFVVGFPTSRVTELRATRNASYQAHTVFFYGKQIVSESIDGLYYEFLALRQKTSPKGVSGAPIWMIRDTEAPNAPLLVDSLDSARIQEANFTLRFSGIAVRFDSASDKFEAIKSEACRQFITGCVPNMDRIRDSKEHDNIKNWEQFQLAGGYRLEDENC